jgi:DNA/RNA-binding domain of Phe-tRNA-synthetase-like protein
MRGSPKIALYKEKFSTVPVPRTDAKLVRITRQSAREQFNLSNDRNFMISIENEITELALGSLTAAGLKNQPSDSGFEDWFAVQLEQAREAVAEPWWEDRRNSVRVLLRKGGFKPSGRSKPAQEYLLRCLNEENFPRVNRAVDCLNIVSVRTGFPISLLKRDCFPEGAKVRFGQLGESYVFNSVGHELDLSGLICVCGDDLRAKPVGTPVKDSLAGKINEETSDIVFFVYGLAHDVGQRGAGQKEVDAAATDLHEALERWCR